jgi:tryptophanyl-tRNA synthetase
MQDTHECLFMMADLHAITVPQNPADLTRNTRETAAAFIACGIDPKRSALFPQSAVTMHAELAWILNCHTPLGWLDRMTQYKEKSGASKFEAREVIHGLKGQKNRLKELQKRVADKVPTDISVNPNVIDAIVLEVMLEANEDAIEYIENSIDKKSKSGLGLYAYPVLMAADILGYHATHVPVGEDQKQHLELARDIAGAFNRAYGEEFFPLPEPLIMPTAARIMSLRDGSKKMSKSDPSDYSRITLTDDVDSIAKKIRKATTDSTPGVTYDPVGRPEVANLLTIYAALTDSTAQEVAEKYAGEQTLSFKNNLVEIAVEKLSPITARMRELMNDHSTLDAILKDGANRARAIAQPILDATMRRVGFLRV